MTLKQSDMRVYNKHHQDTPSSAVYIGRGTPLQCHGDYLLEVANK